MDPLAELLSSLASEGQHDSSASFTLDLFGSHQRLRASLLEQPGAYLLKLVQAAIATSPEEVRVVQRARDLQVTFPLTWNDPVFHDLPEAFLSPLDERWNRATRHLALGLHAAAGQDMEFVAVVRTRPGGLAGCLVTPSGLRLLELDSDSSGPEACHIRLRKRQGPGWLAWLGLGARAAEAAVMRELNLSACPISLDGVRLAPARLNFPFASSGGLQLTTAYQGLVDRHLISRQPLATLLEAPSARVRRPALFDLGNNAKDLGLQASVVLHQWRAPDHHQDLFPAGPPPAAFVVEDDRLWGVVGDRPSDYELGTFYRRNGREATPALFVHGAEGFSLGDCRRPTIASHACISLPCPSRVQHGTLQLVLDGLALQPQEVDLGYPGALAVVADPGIRTDLSQRAPVTDERYEALLDYLRGHVRQMAKEARSAVRFGERLNIPGNQLDALRGMLKLGGAE